MSQRPQAVSIALSKARQGADMAYFLSEQVGKTQAMTPEGFLLCKDVAIGRTGMMIYGPGETPVPVGPDGVAYVYRNEEDLFRPETIASFAGKPVVNDHPGEDVTAENWKQYAVGSVLDPHRGSDQDKDLLIADMLITDQAAIEDVLAGKREVSCGYDADYDYNDQEPGRGRQFNIIGNHVALVDRGRCGSRCAIGDEALAEETSMKGHKIWDRIKDAWDKRDKKAFDAAIEEAEKEEKEVEDARSARDAEREKEMKEVKDGLDKLSKAFDSHKKAMDEKEEKEHKEAEDKRHSKDAEEEEERKRKESEDKKHKDAESEKEEEEMAKEATGDCATDRAKLRKARDASDSSFMEQSFRETMSLAEVISPGIQLPTFDAKTHPKQTLDSLCKLRRAALGNAAKTADGMEMIESVLGTKTFDLEKITCDGVRTLFRSVGAMKKRANNNAASRDNLHSTAMGQPANSSVRTIADLNKLNRERYNSTR